MNEYLFETTATMKEYNREHWWIDSGIIRPFTVEADTLPNALNQYRDIVENKYFVNISKNALSHKNAMYRDTDNGPVQIGYVITGSTDMQTNDYKWSKQYIDLWVTIRVTKYPDFEKEV